MIDKTTIQYLGLGIQGCFTGLREYFQVEDRLPPKLQSLMNILKLTEERKVPSSNPWAWS